MVDIYPTQLTSCVPFKRNIHGPSPFTIFQEILIILDDHLPDCLACECRLQSEQRSPFIPALSEPRKDDHVGRVCKADCQLVKQRHIVLIVQDVVMGRLLDKLLLY